MSTAYIKGFLIAKKNICVPHDLIRKGPELAEGLGQLDDVRTYGSKNETSVYSKIVQEVIAHMVACEQECPQLLIQFNALSALFTPSSEYRVQAG